MKDIAQDTIWLGDLGNTLRKCIITRNFAGYGFANLRF